MYLSALLQEIKTRSEQIKKRTIVSVYFGGGTPFLFGPHRVEKVLSEISSLSSVETSEITLETNPETSTLEALTAYRALGINRLSIGAQSFDPCHLQYLQRGHTAADITSVIEQSMYCGFSNISLDLMYDLPGLSLPIWEKTIHTACALPIQHLSLYNLTIEQNTAWYRRKAEIEASMPNEETSLQMYDAAIQITKECGFAQYEISAFAKSGYQSRHNSGYWEGREFLGFGPSAFSFFNGKRFSNVSNIFDYCHALEQCSSPIDFIDEVSQENRLREMVAIGLRMNKGVHLPSLERAFGQANSALLSSLKNLECLGLLIRDGEQFSLSVKGRSLYDSIAVELI